MLKVDNSVAEYWMNRCHVSEKFLESKSKDALNKEVCDACDRYKKLYDNEMATVEALTENADDLTQEIDDLKAVRDAMQERIDRLKIEIVYACETVGKDIEGEFPSDAHDLACMVIELRARGGLG